VLEFNYEQKQTRRSMIALRSTMMMVLVVLGCGGEELVASSSRNYLCASDRLGVGVKE
jgi:hypothetical protein